MTHNPQNKDCPLNGSRKYAGDASLIECTCPQDVCSYSEAFGQDIRSAVAMPPAVDRVEEIRARHQDASEELPSPNYNTFTKQLWEMHQDRTTLLSALDKANAEIAVLRPENALLRKQNDDLHAFLAQDEGEEVKQLRAELEVVKVESDRYRKALQVLELNYSVGTITVSAQIARAALQGDKHE